MLIGFLYIFWTNIYSNSLSILKLGNLSFYWPLIILNFFLVSLAWFFSHSIEISPTWLKQVFMVPFFLWGYSLLSDSILDQQVNKCWNSFCALFHSGYCGGYSVSGKSGVCLEELIVWLGEMMSVCETTRKRSTMLCSLLEPCGADVNAAESKKERVIVEWGRRERLHEILSLSWKMTVIHVSGHMGKGICMGSTMKKRFGEDHLLVCRTEQQKIEKKQRIPFRSQLKSVVMRIWITRMMQLRTRNLRDTARIFCWKVGKKITSVIELAHLPQQPLKSSDYGSVLPPSQGPQQGPPGDQEQEQPPKTWCRRCVPLPLRSSMPWSGMPRSPKNKQASSSSRNKVGHTSVPRARERSWVMSWPPWGKQQPRRTEPPPLCHH